MNGVKYFDLQPAGLEDDSMMLTDTKGREVSALHRTVLRNCSMQKYQIECSLVFVIRLVDFCMKRCAKARELTLQSRRTVSQGC